CLRLLEDDVGAAPRLIIREAPLVPTTVFALLGEQDGAWSERARLAEPRLELQRAAEGDHVLPRRVGMPVAAGAGGALREAHVGRVPRPGSVCSSLELRELQRAFLEVLLAVVARVEPDQRKRHRYPPVRHLPV